MTKEDAYLAILQDPNGERGLRHHLRLVDLDALADGIVAHRRGQGFHENPDGDALTAKRLSWSIGWNERALREP
jgi:hypothetical protein